MFLGISEDAWGFVALGAGATLGVVYLLYQAVTAGKRARFYDIELLRKKTKPPRYREKEDDHG